MSQRVIGMVPAAHDGPAAGGAFFGRRKGHRLRQKQAALLETLLPRLALDLVTPAPADLCGLFDAPVDDVWLEIGFGGGEHLIAQARAHPRRGFVGVEPFVNGMAKALALIDAEGLRNIRLHHGDATDLIRWLPRGTVAGVDLLYPDPWPKRRHWKRRFVQDASLAEIGRIVMPAGTFRFASDIATYVAWTLRRALRSRDLMWTAERADDWRMPWPGFIRTRYEAKALREGRVPAYLVFRRV
jgi:tRNA (guanine-N7-)-methyltransferase